MELKDCPFCPDGGRVEEKYLRVGKMYHGIVRCTDCGAMIEGHAVLVSDRPTQTILSDSLNEARSKWNLRNEPTCRLVDETSRYPSWNYRMCSECDKPIAKGSNYCPHCGRKVIK